MGIVEIATGPDDIARVSTIGLRLREHLHGLELWRTQPRSRRG
jgi:hypothetical protein